MSKSEVRTNMRSLAFAIATEVVTWKDLFNLVSVYKLKMGMFD